MKPLLYSLLPRPPHPTRDGSAIRSYHLLAALVQEFRVRVFALRPPGSPASATEVPEGVELEELPGPSRGRRLAAAARSLADGEPYSIHLYRSDRLSRRVASAAAAQRPAWILVHGYHLGPLAIELPSPTWIDFHNVESQIWSRVGQTSRSSAVRSFARLQAPRVRRCEERLLRRATGVSCVSEPDARGLEALLPGCAPLLVPNGVDLGRYRFRAGPAPEKLVFFVGDLAWPPNADGIAWFQAAVWPLVRKRHPDARAVVLGRRAPSRLTGSAPDGVEFPGEGDDTRTYWRRASVSIVPLRAGGGTRLKVLEAAASGVPVVSTAIGAEGLDLEPDREILLREEPGEFAEAVSSLLDSETDRRRIAVAARRKVEHLYGWEAIGASLAASLAARRPLS